MVSVLENTPISHKCRLHVQKVYVGHYTRYLNANFVVAVTSEL